MDKLQEKAIKEALTLLKSIDSYNIYKALVASIEEAGVQDDKPFTKTREAYAEELRKADQAKNWLEALISAK